MNKGRRQDNGRYGSVFAEILTKEFLTEHYNNQKKSPYKIADEVGCSPKLVYNYIKHHNIPKVELRGILLSNQSFGLLTTIKPVGKTKNGTVSWLCKCSCGNEVKVPTSRLKNGRTKSCGCYRKRKRNHKWKGYCDISGSRISEIRLRARKKKMDFDIDAKFLWELILKQKYLCAISKLKISLDKNASVDRIDSSKGYTKDNVWWVHKDINKMKMDLPMDRFLELCDTVSQSNKEQ